MPLLHQATINGQKSPPKLDRTCGFLPGRTSMILASPLESSSALLPPYGYLFLPLFSSISLEMKLVAMRYLLKPTHTFRHATNKTSFHSSNYAISGMLCQTELMCNLLQAYPRDKTEATLCPSRYVYLLNISRPP